MDDFSTAATEQTDHEKAKGLMVLLNNYIHGVDMPVPSSTEASLINKAEGFDFGILLTIGTKDEKARFNTIQHVLTHSGATINQDRDSVGANREEIFFNKDKLDCITKGVSSFIKVLQNLKPEESPALALS